MRLPSGLRPSRGLTRRLPLPPAWRLPDTRCAASRGRRSTGKTHPLYALVCDQRAQRRALGRYRAWLETEHEV